VRWMVRSGLKTITVVPLMSKVQALKANACSRSSSCSRRSG